MKSRITKQAALRRKDETRAGPATPRKALVGSGPSDRLEVMTLPEVATYLTCHYSTVFRLLKAGDLPGFRLGGDWRFLRTEIDKWISERQARPYAPGKSVGRGPAKRGPKPKR